MIGTLEMDEVHVASRYGGRVVFLRAKEGDQVKLGEVIAVLDVSELQARRDLAKAQLDELIKGPRAQEVAVAFHEWEAMKAQLVFAEADAKRGAELVKQRAVSSSEAEKTEAQANALRKSAAAAEFRYALLKEGTRPEQIAQAEARLAEAEAQLRETQIIAPADCTLELLHVKVGDVVAPNREIATLVLNGEPWMKVYVPAAELEKWCLGRDVSLQLDGKEKTRFAGRVIYVSRVAEFTPRNVQTEGDRAKQRFAVKISFEGAKDRLRGGMSGTVTALDKLSFVKEFQSPGGGEAP